MSITMYQSKRHGEHSIDLTVVVELISLQKELSKHFITMSYSKKMPLHYIYRATDNFRLARIFR